METYRGSCAGLSVEFTTFRRFEQARGCHNGEVAAQGNEASFESHDGIALGEHQRSKDNDASQNSGEDAERARALGIQQLNGKPRTIG
jgi:hypothetical protein